MENNTKEKNVCHLGGGMCGAGCDCKSHHLHLWRWFLKIALIVIVVCFAYQLGELRVLCSPYMDHGRDRGINYRQGQMMDHMNAYGSAGVPETYTAPTE